MKQQTISVETSRQFNELVREFWNNRIGFFKHVMGVDALSTQQADALQALDEHDHLAIKSGVETGKTMMLAGIILHYASCRYPFKIPCTSPSKDQLRNVLWPELAMWHRQMRPIFRDRLVWTKEKLLLKDDESSFAVARTATKDNPESLQGFHSEYVMRVIDEGSGVHSDIYDVLEGATGTRETKSIMTGNPTRLEGEFFEAFSKASSFYKLFTFSSLDSGITKERTIERIRKKYGEDSNMFRVRILGEFPLRDGDSFIPYDLVYDALMRDIPDQAGFHKVFGCDIARFGDDETVIAIRQGDEFKPYHVLRNKSTMEVASYIAFLANKEKPSHIFVDVIGIGAGVYDRLEQLGFPVIAVNVSESPAVDGRKYKRLRDELWGLMRDWLELRRGKIWDNGEQDLLGQLSTPKYRIAADGKIVIESKDDMRRRGVASPNIADAFNMTFAQPISNYSKEEDTFFEDLYGEREVEFALDKEAGY